MEGWFAKAASGCSRAAGKSITFILALSVIITWGVTGPMFDFSDTWQLIINTSTTIVTFLMVFLIQNSQNRDGKAIQAKLDELIAATEGARNDLERIEDKTEIEIEEIRR